MLRVERISYKLYIMVIAHLDHDRINQFVRIYLSYFFFEEIHWNRSQNHIDHTHFHQHHVLHKPHKCFLVHIGHIYYFQFDVSRCFFVTSCSCRTNFGNLHTDHQFHQFFAILLNVDFERQFLNCYIQTEINYLSTQF